MKPYDVAKLLLEKKAVVLAPKEPFTFASGIRSPIYCDNRKMISFPRERKMIVEGYCTAVMDTGFDIVAGTSTAGIPWAAWISEMVGKPMAYVRSGKKDHGFARQIEGADVKDRKVLVIEDLISTGGSSLETVEAVRSEGGKVVLLAAIFTYGFEKAGKAFSDAGCRQVTLSDFSQLIQAATDMDYISEIDRKVCLEWVSDPSGWGPKHGFPNAR